MKRYCISDMHLVDEGHRDSFARGNRLYRFRRFLDYVDANDGKLYILGDLLDIYQGALWKIVQTYSRLLTDLAEVTSMWVHGNHDGLFGGLLGTPLEELYVPRSRIFSRYSKPFCRTLGDVTILFCHGHECDPYCKDGNPGPRRADGHDHGHDGGLLRRSDPADWRIRGGRLPEDAFLLRRDAASLERQPGTL